MLTRDGYLDTQVTRFSQHDFIFCCCRSRLGVISPLQPTLLAGRKQAASDLCMTTPHTVLIELDFAIVKATSTCKHKLLSFFIGLRHLYTNQLHTITCYVYMYMQIPRQCGSVHAWVVQLVSYIWLAFTIRLRYLYIRLRPHWNNHEFPSPGKTFLLVKNLGWLPNRDRETSLYL